MSEHESEHDEKETTMEDLQLKMEFLEKRFLGTSFESSTPFAPRSTIETKISKISSMHKSEKDSEKEEQKIMTKLPMVKLPEFSGVDFEEFLDDFQRWLRMTNVISEPQDTKIDWLLEACSIKVRPMVKKLMSESTSLSEILQHMSKLFPKLDNDLTLRSKLDKIQPLVQNAEPSQVAQLFLEMEELMNKMSKGAMSDQEKFILLTKKIHPRTYTEMRSDRFFKRRTETYSDLKSALLEKVEEDWQERHLVQLRKEHVHALQDETPQKFPGKGKGKGKGHSTQNGKGFNKRVQNDEPPKFHASITCKYCKKRGHYDTKCWFKYPELRPKPNANAQKKKTPERFQKDEPITNSMTSTSSGNWGGIISTDCKSNAITEKGLQQ